VLVRRKRFEGFKNLKTLLLWIPVASELKPIEPRSPQLERERLQAIPSEGSKKNCFIS